MNIQYISKKDREVTVELSASELIAICNALHNNISNTKNDAYYQLYSELIIARDLCQYGHLDNHSISTVVRTRNKCEHGMHGLLSKEETTIFNEQIEKANMEQAFNNPEWCHIYNNLVGNRKSDTIKQWIERNN